MPRTAAPAVPARPDVLVVGAGPAGSAAAINARRLRPSAEVLLVDASDFPRDKTCGDGVGPDGVEVLERLGIRDVVLDGYPPIGRVRVRAPNGTEASGDAPRAGHVLPRTVLDDRLRTAAIDAGAVTLTGRVTAVGRDGTCTVRVGDVDHRVRARTVVGADGANSTVRRSLGIPAQARERTGLAMRGYADAPPGWPEELFIGFVTQRWPAYVWAFPDGRGRLNVGYGPFDATTVHNRRDLVDGIAAHLPTAPDGSRVQVEPETLKAHHLPLSTARPRPAHGRVLLVGDAASLVHPLTGEGIYYGLLSGAMAGACAVRFPADPGRAYTRALRQRLGRHLRHTTAAAAMFRSTYPVDLSVEAAAKNPATLAELCEFALGTGLVSADLVARLTRASVRDVGRVLLRR